MSSAAGPPAGCGRSHRWHAARACARMRPASISRTCSTSVPGHPPLDAGIRATSGCRRSDSTHGAGSSNRFDSRLMPLAATAASAVRWRTPLTSHAARWNDRHAGAADGRERAATTRAAAQADDEPMRSMRAFMRPPPGRAWNRRAPSRRCRRRPWRRGRRPASSSRSTATPARRAWRVVHRAPAAAAPRSRPARRSRLHGRFARRVDVADPDDIGTGERAPNSWARSRVRVYRCGWNAATMRRSRGTCRARRRASHALPSGDARSRRRP
jgi:hypothetical protein